MRAAKSWLEELTLPKLHRLATTLGTPCSGTKTARIAGINHTLDEIKRDGSSRNDISLLSIDMGIRNLAFAHITAPSSMRQSLKQGIYLPLKLTAWQRVAVSSTTLLGSGIESVPVNEVSESTASAEMPAVVAAKESFEPKDYAKYAYHLCDQMLRTYQPTHVLIERQRFRSGGQSAVLEWTIRVGVFEGMLYSAFETLKQERKLNFVLEPVQPPRVNRYWLGQDVQTGTPAKGKLTGREVKQEKIKVVARMIESQPAALDIGEAVKVLAGEFVSRCNKSFGIVSRRGAGSDLSKLDDLSDSLLQGIAYLHWQNNRRRVARLGRDAIEMDTGAVV